MKRATRIDVCYKASHDAHPEFKKFTRMNKAKKFIKSTFSANLTRQSLLLTGKKRKIDTTARLIWRNGALKYMQGANFDYNVWNNF